MMFHDHKIEGNNDIPAKESLEKQLKVFDMMRQGFLAKQRSQSTGNLFNAYQLLSEVSESDDESAKLHKGLVWQFLKLDKEILAVERGKKQADIAIKKLEEKIQSNTILVLERLQKDPEGYRQELSEDINSKNVALKSINKVKEAICAKFRELLEIEGAIYKEIDTYSGSNIYSMKENGEGQINTCKESQANIYSFQEDNRFSVIQGVQINALRAKEESFEQYDSEAVLRYAENQKEEVFKIKLKKYEKELLKNINEIIKSINKTKNH